jgi:hypothetical protein
MKDDECKSIIDSMDDLQQRLRLGHGTTDTLDDTSPGDLEQAKRILIGRREAAESEFRIGRPVLAATPPPPTKSQDRVFLESLVAEADRIVAMLAGNN